MERIIHMFKQVLTLQFNSFETGCGTWFAPSAADSVRCPPVSDSSSSTETREPLLQVVYL